MNNKMKNNLVKIIGGLFVSTLVLLGMGKNVKADNTYRYYDNSGAAAKETDNLGTAVSDAYSGSTITMTGNAQFTSQEITGKELTLDLNGYTLTGDAATGTTPDFLIKVAADATLTITDSSANKEGKITESNVNTYKHAIYNAGNLNLNSGCISKFESTAEGAGVYIDGNGTGATFTMSGGSIKECSSSGSGGGVYVDGEKATFKMKEGFILKCKSTADPIQSAGYTQYKGGGGVAVVNGTFDKTGGEINECSAKNGGGVFVFGQKATFTMDGGNIKECTVAAAENNGNGGGVLVCDGATFTFISGAIEACTANNSAGGGVYLYDSAVYNMTGGNINNCSANHGGGVCAVTPLSGTVYKPSTVNMTGGIISACTAAEYGGGVSLDVKSKMNISGYTAICDNSTQPNNAKGNVYVFGGSVEQGENMAPEITVTGELTAGDIKICFSEETNDKSIKLKDNIIYEGINHIIFVVKVGNKIEEKSSYLKIVGDDIKIVADDNSDNICTVTFLPKNGAPDYTMRLENGCTIPLPEELKNLTKEGYVFDGWYKDETFTKEWKFFGEAGSDDCKISGDTIICAKWAAKKLNNINLDTHKLYMKKGESKTIKYTVDPVDCVRTDVEWSSSNASVATVDSDGKITAVGGGECEITVMSKEDNTKKDTCSVIVTNKDNPTPTPDPKPTPTPEPTPEPVNSEKRDEVFVDKDTFKSEVPEGTVMALNAADPSKFLDLKVHSVDVKTNANQEFLANYYAKILGGSKANVILTKAIYPRRELSITEKAEKRFLVWNNLPIKTPGKIYAVCYDKDNKAYLLGGAVDATGTAVFADYRVAEATNISIFMIY